MENAFTSPDSFADDPSFRDFVRNTDPAAVAKWTAWLAQHPNRTRDVEEAVLLVRRLDVYRPRQVTEAEVEQEVARLQHRLIQESTGQPSASEPVTNLRPLHRWQHIRPWYAVAASVALLLVSYALFWVNQPLSGDAYVALTGKTASAKPAETTLPGTSVRKPLVKTDYGQRRTIQLPDGSSVTLNAHSTLTLSPGWSTGKREVLLTGEAFFRVSKQQRGGQPVKFVVRANNVAVEVLGTQFDVSTRNQRVKVVLNEGRIRLKVLADNSPSSTPTRTLDMLPGDLVEVTGQQSVTLNSRVETAEHSAWVTGELVFEDVPLAEVATVIQNNYGYTVEFVDPALADQRLTAILPDSNLDVLLKALEKAFSLSITKQQNTIRFAKALQPVTR